MTIYIVHIIFYHIISVLSTERTAVWKVSVNFSVNNFKSSYLIVYFLRFFCENRRFSAGFSCIIVYLKISPIFPLRFPDISWSGQLQYGGNRSIM